MKEAFEILVTEQVSCFKDCTEALEQAVQNIYTLELEINDRGEITESRETIQAKLIPIVEGMLLFFEII